MTLTILLVDPPEGWMYGFPKPMPSMYSPKKIAKWFLDQGYPKELIDRGMLNHCRYITQEIKDEVV